MIKGQSRALTPGPFLFWALQRTDMETSADPIGNFTTNEVKKGVTEIEKWIGLQPGKPCNHVLETCCRHSGGDGVYRAQQLIWWNQEFAPLSRTTGAIYQHCPLCVF